jgi:TM2 domain-containing membrane protein YozV
MDGIISYKMCAVEVRNAKLRNYLNTFLLGVIVAACLYESVVMHLGYRDNKNWKTQEL